jgi:HNH endonuclease
VGKEPADAFTKILDDLIAWSNTLGWAIEHAPRTGSQAVVKFVIRGTPTPFWTASPNKSEPTKLAVIDTYSTPSVYPADVQTRTRDALAELEIEKYQTKRKTSPAVSFEALHRSPEKVATVKSLLLDLLAELSPLRTKVLLSSRLPPVVQGKTWLGTDADSGAGRIDVMLIEGATQAEMEEARGAVPQHLHSLKTKFKLPIAKKWDFYVFDRKALGATAVVPAVVNRRDARKEGAVEDVELRVHGRERVKLPFSDQEATPVTLLAGGEGFDATYHATERNTQFTYLYQRERKGPGVQTLADFLRACGVGPQAKVELEFGGSPVTLRHSATPSTESPGVSPATSVPQPPPRKTVTLERVVRDTEVARRVKALHGYRCQVCGSTIELPNGGCYAEAHHIKPLGEPHGGYDVESNVMCVCPNHHAELDLALWDIDPSGLRTAEGHTIDPEYVRYHNEDLRARWR